MENAESHYQLNLMISEKPFSNDGTYIISYLINMNELVYGLYQDFYLKVKNLNLTIYICYSILIVLFSFVCLKKFFNKLDEFKNRITELNENKILSMINKQNEKKNLLRLRKLNSFNLEKESSGKKINKFHKFILIKKKLTKILQYLL